MLKTRMKNATLNLRDLVILVADPSPYMCMLANSMLRDLGQTKRWTPAARSTPSRS